MNYTDIKKFDIANGPYVRTSLFVSGCPNHCDGCFNPETWDYENGKPFTENTMNELLEDLKPNYIKGFTMLGGEPLSPPNIIKVRDIIKTVRETYPDMNIWCYTGYTLDEVLAKYNGDTNKRDAALYEILEMINVLVDGRFVKAEKDPSILFRGSKNQRLIDMKKTLAATNSNATLQIVEWEKPDYIKS